MHLYDRGLIVEAFGCIGVTDQLLYDVENPEQWLEDLCQYIFAQRFNTPRSKLDMDIDLQLKNGIITQEEAQEMRAELHERVFDDLIDSDIIQLYVLDKFNVDLTKDNVTWFKYVQMREYMMLDKNAPIHKRIEFRSHKNKSGKEYREYNEFMRTQKAKYNIN